MYPDNFYNFKDGSEIDNQTINRWLERVRKELIVAGDGEYNFVSAGDTFVLGLKNPDEYWFIVFNRHGRSEFVVDRHEQNIHEINFLENRELDIIE